MVAQYELAYSMPDLDLEIFAHRFLPKERLAVPKLVTR